MKSLKTTKVDGYDQIVAYMTEHNVRSCLMCWEYEGYLWAERNDTPFLLPLGGGGGLSGCIWGLTVTDTLYVVVGGGDEG